MRLLFELDLKNYNANGTVFRRPSVRGIIIRQGKIAMVHAKKFNYYKFPGGGIEPGECHEEALVRETLEETGLAVLPESIRAYGYVHRIQKGTREDMFVQHSFYYFCHAEEKTEEQKMSAYEAEERFTLEFVDPKTAIRVNREENHGPSDPIMIEREARVLECLLAEGYFA